jgi:hypothetical protein
MLYLVLQARRKRSFEEGYEERESIPLVSTFCIEEEPLTVSSNFLAFCAMPRLSSKKKYSNSLPVLCIDAAIDQDPRIRVNLHLESEVTNGTKEEGTNHTSGGLVDAGSSVSRSRCAGRRFRRGSRSSTTLGSGSKSG